jgi:hypothetical protein
MIHALVIPALHGADIRYMVTGSLPSPYHGEPRATRDLDLVIDPSPASLERLVDGLRASGFYVDADMARRALTERSQFNAIRPSAEKVDFVIRKERPFSIEEFGRREPADLLGTLGFSSPTQWTLSSPSSKGPRHPILIGNGGMSWASSLRQMTSTRRTSSGGQPRQGSEKLGMQCATRRDRPDLSVRASPATSRQGIEFTGEAR